MPVGSSTVEKFVTFASVAPDSRRPPTPSSCVTMPVICGAFWASTAIPNRPLPCVVMPVTGRVELGPLTTTPLPALRSARTPAIVVPWSPRSTRPSPTESVTVTPSRPTPDDPLSWSPVLLRANVVRTTVPVLPALNPRPARDSGSVACVPRSLTVESAMSRGPFGATAMNGRPEPGATGCCVAASTEVTVTPWIASRPLPV